MFSNILRGGLLTLLLAGSLVGCGVVDSGGLFDEKKSSSLTEADGCFVYITLDDCYPVDLSVVSVADMEHRQPVLSSPAKREEYYKTAQILTYDEDFGGYGVFLEDGTYEISLICDAEGVTYNQSRFVVADEEHTYYHVRFTEQAFQYLE